MTALWTLFGVILDIFLLYCYFKLICVMDDKLNK